MTGKVAKYTDRKKLLLESLKGQRWKMILKYTGSSFMAEGETTLYYKLLQLSGLKDGADLTSKFEGMLSWISTLRIDTDILDIANDLEECIN